MATYWAILVQSRRDKKAAKKFFRKLLRELRYVPRAIITDKLKSYSAAKAEVLPGVRTLPAEVSEQPRGEFSSTNQVARAGDETVQIRRTRAALSLGVRDHHVTLPAGATPLYCQRLSSDVEA